MPCSPAGTPARTRALLAGVGVLLASGLGACGDAGAGSSEQTLTLLAAASLTGVYGTLGDAFEKQAGGVEVDASFGSSTDLAELAADGAPGDVLSTADQTSMAIAEDAGAVADPQVFATNRIVLAVPAGDPAAIGSIDDLAGTTWVRCADDVPCGRAALALVDANSVADDPVSLEEDVRSALEKVTSGEADAALVYASDAESAGDAVESIEIPGAEEQLAFYHVGATEQAADPALARAWVDLVLSEEGRAALEDAGFGTP